MTKVAKSLRLTAIANRDVRGYVNARDNFRTHTDSIFSTTNRLTGLYVVFSYGQHFPMYAYDPDVKQWFGNSDKYSRTTSSHQTYARPDADIHWLNTDAMESLFNVGSYADYCANRILKGAVA